MPHAKLDSHEIYYQDLKRSDDTMHTLLFIHGAGGNLLSWSGQVGYSFEKSRLLIPELPGHGNSDGRGFATIDEYRAVLMQFLDALSVPKVVPIGHSMGGAIAIDMLINNPERVEAAVLVDTSAILPVNRIIFDKIEESPLSAVGLVCRFSFSRATPQSLVDKTITEMARCSGEVLKNDFTACNTYNQTGSIYSITHRVLILCGKEDKMTPPANSEFLGNEIINSRLVLIEEAGHMTMLEKPDEVNDAINTLLISLTG